MNIGNHQILGKKTKLKNPILVCQKVISSNTIDHKSTSENKIKIVKIITDKIFFNSRPTPILKK